MIFNNTLNINSNNYDCSYGASLALVESARNDFNIFKAMIECDYNEINIKNKYSGYVMESEINALHEAAKEGIFKKIINMIKAFIKWLKKTFTSFFTKIRDIFKKDKKNIDKLIDKIPDNSKDDIPDNSKDDIEITVIELKNDAYNSFNNGLNMINDIPSIVKSCYDENEDKLFNNLARKITGNENVTYYLKFYDEFRDIISEGRTFISNDNDNKKLKDYFDGYDKYIAAEQKKFDDIIKRIDSTKNEYFDKMVAPKKEKGKLEEDQKKEIESVCKAYAVCNCIRRIISMASEVIIQIYKDQYRSYKAALIKLGTIKESAIYTEALIDADSEEFDIMMANTIPEENNYNSNEFPSYNELFY